MYFSNIKKSSELKDFLVKRTSRHKFLFHYTKHGVFTVQKQ